MPPRIRRLTSDDEPALTTFVAAAVERGDLLGSATPRGEWLVKFLMPDPGKAAVADDDGRVVGMVVPGAKAIVVDPSYRRQGIGRALVAEAVAIERDTHDEVILGVLPDDDVGRAFLGATGFAFHSTLWDLELPAGRPVASPTWPAGYRARTFDRAADVEALVALFNAAFADHPTPLQTDVPGTLAGMADPGFLRSEDTLLVEASGGAFAGFCASEPRRLPEGGVAPHAEIWTIGVHPDHQGRGLGRALLRWGVAHLRELGVETVELSVNGRNPRALALYEAEGFERRATRDRWARPVDPSPAA